MNQLNNNPNKSQSVSSALCTVSRPEARRRVVPVRAEVEGGVRGGRGAAHQARGDAREGPRDHRQEGAGGALRQEWQGRAVVSLLMSRADRKSQCLGLSTADFLSSLAYESAEQKPKHCQT